MRVARWNSRGLLRLADGCEALSAVRIIFPVFYMLWVIVMWSLLGGDSYQDGACNFVDLQPRPFFVPGSAKR